MTGLPMASQNSEGAEFVPRRRDPMNAPGPFYTEADTCMTCLLPESQAPDLMGLSEDYGSPGFGCFFRKQPQTPEELSHAFGALRVSCLATLRDAGHDPAILRRLRQLGMESQCDFPLPGTGM